MNEQIEIREFNYTGIKVKICIPDESFVQQTYHVHKKENPQTAFPFWAKLWPAAVALADFLSQHQEYIENKEVLELAAGLGLPSLVAAKSAKSVYVTDYLPDAVDLIEKSRELNALDNMTCGLLNWHHLPDSLEADILLMSDVNYDPFEFEQLYKVFMTFLEKGTTIILSTPQRLMAKPFIEKMLKYAIVREQIFVMDTAISVFILKAE
jgi:predicted nicotinamide N-methyase